MKLWEIIKERRERKNLTQKELAKLVGCSSMHISVIERPYSETQRTASDELLRKLAKVLASSEDKVEELEKTFLIEKLKITAPPELIGLLDQKKRMLDMRSLPATFIARLKSDLEKNQDVNIYEQTGISAEGIQNVLSGNQLLHRKEIISLAMALNQNIEDYLLLSDFLPDNVKEFLEHTHSRNLFRAIESLLPSDVDAMINIFNNVVNVYKETKKSK